MIASRSTLFTMGGFRFQSWLKRPALLQPGPGSTAAIVGRFTGGVIGGWTLARRASFSILQVLGVPEFTGAQNNLCAAMNPQTRKLLIQRLVPAIGVIGPEFERFGNVVLDNLLTVPLEHTGTNALGFPISRVLDSSSADGAVVAEYSAENDYFTRDMPKAEKDLKHALDRRPDAKLILLLAAQPMKPQIVDDWLKLVLARPAMKGRSVRVWGAERIAGHLIDKVTFNDTAVAALSAYLPVLTEIWEEAARDRLFPAPDPRHQPRPAVSEEIRRRLAAAACLSLGGIAGSGKSDAAKAYGADRREDYQLQIWLDRDEVRRVEDLHAIPLIRGQDKRNIASLMKTRTCLVVIDDPATALDTAALAALCGPGSHVLVTARELGSEVFEMPPLSEAEARIILEADAAGPCPGDVFDTIWQTVGGHPLSLALMNGAVREGASWADIAVECAAVGKLPDPVQRLADRLLLRGRAHLQDALAVFEWAGQSTCDAGFLRRAVQPGGVRNLQRHALTAADRDAVVRLHDVVYSSLASLDWWAPAIRVRLDDLLEAYIAEASVRDDLSLWSVAGTFRTLLEARVAAGDARPAFLLALLMAWAPEEIVTAALGDPAARAAALADAGQPVSGVEIRVLLETVEQLFRRAKPQGPEAVKAFLEASLPMFDSLAALPELTARQAAEIHHHRGKVYRWLRRDDDARREFDAVMAGPSPLHATRLQLIRQYKRTSEFEAAGRLGEEVLTAAEMGGDVTPSVLLAVIQDLPWRDAEVRERLLWPRGAFIEQTITGYANAGYDQAYKTLAAVARWWSQDAPQVLARVLADIPAPSPERVDDDESRFLLGDILLELARASDTGVEEIRQRALTFFEAQERPSYFHQQRHAELLLDMGQAEAAERLLRAHKQLETSCWVQRLIARARLAQGDPSEALTWIDRALTDANGVSRHDEFLHLRYEIRRARRDTDAIDDLRTALDHAAPGRRRDDLEVALAAAEALDGSAA
jgi:tetratricopeptide (TPR) repeat protein